MKTINLSLSHNKKAYFASDQHFGFHTSVSQKLNREFLFCQWLDQISSDAEHLFLLGDLFDFWLEYKEVIPKGFIRVLGKIASLSDKGIEIYFFTGNHDMWIRDYFEKELKIKIFRHPQSFLIGDKKILVGHGDGLGGRQLKYKVFKWFLLNPIFLFLFRQIHPDTGLKIGRLCSNLSRQRSRKKAHLFSPEQEHLLLYSKKTNQTTPHDYFIFGHRHIPNKIELASNTYYINTGDWIKDFTYVFLTKEEIVLKKYETDS